MYWLALETIQGGWVWWLTEFPSLPTKAESDYMLATSKKRISYAVRRHDRSLCIQKQPETAALKAAISPV